MAPSTLDSYITTSTPPPSPLATSQKIVDRNSTFLGFIYRIPSSSSSPSSPSSSSSSPSSPSSSSSSLSPSPSPSPSPSLALKKIHTYHKTIYHHSHHAASHEIAAWRYMSLKEGRNGLGGPDDFEVKYGVEDDGEERGGKCILKVMEQEGVMDVIVIVSRWFGGTLLGPIRFTHIETCTRQVCRTFKAIEEIESIIEQLKQLDEQLQELRAELASISPPSNQDQQSSNSNSNSNSDAQGDSEGGKVTTRKEPPDYNAMLLSPAPDVARARRLVTARQNAIRSVKGILARTKGRSSA